MASPATAAQPVQPQLKLLTACVLTWDRSGIFLISQRQRRPCFCTHGFTPTPRAPSPPQHFQCKELHALGIHLSHLQSLPSPRSLAILSICSDPTCVRPHVLSQVGCCCGPNASQGLRHDPPRPGGLSIPPRLSPWKTRVSCFLL